MIDKIKWFLICFVAGVAIGYFLIPKTPDVKVVKEILTVTKIQDKVIYKDRVIDRKVYVDTGGHTVTEEHEVIKDKIIEKEVEKIIEKKSEKIINYSGAVFVLYDPLDLKIYPSAIGASYLIFNPVSIIAYYDIDCRKIRVGVEIQF